MVEGETVKLKILAVIAASGIAAFAQGFTVTIPATSPTQAVLTYTAPSNSPCTVEVSESNSYSPLVHDVDSGLFPGANQDTRAGALAGTSLRVFVAGTRDIETASDTNKYSRALQQNTLHYYRVTCGSQVATGTFATKTLPYGATYQDLIPVNADGTYNYPTTFETRNSTLIDPQTGVLMSRVSLSADTTTSGGYFWPFPSYGGFGSFCADDRSAYGNYHCALPSFSADALYLYAINPASGAATFLGLAQASYAAMDPTAGGSFGMGTEEVTNWGVGSANVIYRGVQIFGRNTIARWTYTGTDAAPGGPPPVMAAGTTTDMLNGQDLNSLALAFNPNFGKFDLTGTVTTQVTGGVYTINWASGNQFVEGAGSGLNTGMVGRLVNIKGVNYTITSVPTKTTMTGTINVVTPPGPISSPTAYRMSMFVCSMVGSQANYGIIACNAYQQDSPAWIGAYNFGNGIPYGMAGSTAGLTALTAQFADGATRWTGDHTYEFLGETVPITSFSSSTAIEGGVFGDGPYNVVLGESLLSEPPGTVDSNVPIGSAALLGAHNSPYCTDAWTAPSEWVDGEPLSACYPHFLQNLQVGDVMYSTATGESMQVVAITSPTSINIMRGTQQYGGNTPVHPAGEQLTMWGAGFGENYNADQQFGWSYGFWDFVNSPNGTEHAGDYVLNWGTHPVTRGSHRSVYYFDSNANPSNKSEWGVPPPYTVPTNSAFAGVGAIGTGNTYQKHPSIASGSDYSQFDVWYFVGGNAFSAPNNSAATLVCAPSCFAHVYRYDPTGGLAWTAGAVWSRNAPIFAKTSGQNLVDVSAPGKVLSDADDFVWCRPNADGECAAGSHASDPYVYFSLSTLNTNYCTGGENPTTARDICIGNFTTLGLSVGQTKFVTTAADTTGALSDRPLARTFQNYEGASTVSNNVKLTYAGDWGLIWRCTGTPGNSQCATGSQVWALKIPPDPGSDGINRGDFVPAQLSLTAPEGLAVVSARVKFWYTELGGTESTPYCTSRREACVAVSSTVLDLQPFYYASTDAYTPASCATSCTIAIPVYPLHTAYYSVEFLDRLGDVVAKSPGVAVENVVVPGSSTVRRAPGGPVFRGSVKLGGAVRTTIVQ
jgi:hypothetical protein